MPDMKAATLGLDSADACLDDVGGKGINLVRLTRAGFRVPGGFVVGTGMYRRFVAANGLSALISDRLNHIEAVDSAGIEQVSESLREAFSGGVIPEADVAAISSAMRPWLRTPLAVRSSAITEDLPDMSFAGQHDTYLNVIGETALLAAVKDCWSSLWTARAIGYRLRNRVDATDLALAVVVQEMVPAQVSGVMFTANPLTGLRSQTVIEATFGIGEGLVSGAVEPDNFVLDSVTGRLVEVTIGAKATATIARSGGGLETVPAGSGEPCLSTPQLAELAEFGNRIEQLYQSPQDIEWAIADGTLYVLQARGITSLFPVPEATDDRFAVWMSFGAVQGMLEPITPLGQDAIRHLMRGAASMIGTAVPDDGPSFLGRAGERLWIRLDFVLRNPLGRLIAPRVLSMVEPSAGRLVTSLLEESGLNGSGSPGRTWIPRLGRLVSRVLTGVPRMLIDPAGARRRLEIQAAELVAAAGRREADAAALTEPMQCLSARIDALRVGLATAFPTLLPVFAPILAPSLVMIQRLQSLATSAGEGADGLAMETLRALEGNVTTEMDLVLWQVATTIRADPAGSAAFFASTDERLEQRYLAGDLPPVTQQALAEFLARYGMRGVGEIDLGRRRWRDDPSTIVRTVRGYLSIEDPSRAPDAVFRAGAASAARATDDLAAQLRPRHRWAPRLREHQVRFLVRHLRAMAGARETPKFTIVQVFGIIRDGLLDSGRDLVAAGVLEAPDDVVFLTVAELERIVVGSTEGLKALVSKRRASNWREQQRRQVPRIIVSDGRTMYEGLGPIEGALSGSPVSPGTAQGRVRVVLDPADGLLAPGEILVCVGTDPAWTPLFLTAAGLVTEVGGMMTHGAVVAREYGIPAIVGVHEATTRLSTGQLIRIDGTTGLIETLDQEAA